MEKRNCKVCVTGGASYIGSWIVKKFLEKGYTVHATLRNIKDESKVGLLRGLPFADTGLKLFQADAYNPSDFEQAIQGCEFVLHVATPWQHYESSETYRNVREATIACARSIALCCLRSGTVRRLIYTGTVCSASPLKEDGSGFKDAIDETCWTPLNIPLKHSTKFTQDYACSKTMAEKEILTHGSNECGGGLEVVSLACGLVGGVTTIQYSSTPPSVQAFISHLTQDPEAYRSLMFIEELDGKIPAVHIDDVCEAHVFCMEHPSLSGRFLCASSYISSADIALHYRRNHPEFHIKPEHLNDPKREIKWGSKKLNDEGFAYKCDINKILDESVECARRVGDLLC